MPTKRVVRATANLTPAEGDALQRAADLADRTPAAEVRAAILSHLSRVKKTNPATVGTGRGSEATTTHLAVRHVER
jgi:hypothetical protein